LLRLAYLAVWLGHEVENRPRGRGKGEEGRELLTLPVEMAAVLRSSAA
jgi:hypothetical protein